MSSDTHKRYTQSELRTTTRTRLRHTVTKDVKPLWQFWMKFNNDWSWNNAAGLAYNLLLSMFPLVIALLALLGLFLGRLDPGAYNATITHIEQIFPSVTSSQTIIKPALQQLTKNSSFLSIFAIVLAFFNGSRLFLFMQGCFDIIYHVRPRTILRQNAIAVLMLLIFAVLVPVMILASALPALVVSFLQRTPLGHLPGSGFIVGIGGIAGGLIAGYILFQVIYIVVPNQKISFRNSWRGSVVATVLLELYLTLFPLYVTYFLRNFAGTLGILILLIFFYYFAMILFLGAEVNAFFAEDIRTTPYDVPTMVHMMTSHLATSEQAVAEQAAVSHKGEVPKEICPQYEKDRQEETERGTDIST